MVRTIKDTHCRSDYSSPINFPEELPITQHLGEIREALIKHQVVIVVGETGSGKTTQLPKLCLSMGRGQFGAILHTQPRRLAAKGVGQRLQVELAREDAVGVRVRFDDKTSSTNYIQVLTDGLLLNQIAADPLLRDVDTLIIDEAHERSLNIDFLLGLLKSILRKRPEFRLIITSATIQHHLFSEFYVGAPVFHISGRTYPVEIEYLGPDEWHSRDQDPLVCGVIESLVRIYELQPLALFNKRVRGLDTLVFLPGERQIQDVAQGIRRVFGDTFDILPLYARLAGSAQSKVFYPGARTRIVLATNLAETSITVPRIGFVVDSGLVRVSRYSQRRKVQLLPIEASSKASAAQRAGRCGRIAPGVCYRLYDKEDFDGRPEYPEAEIHRTHLAGVILQMKAMKLQDPDAFPFIEPPAGKMINDGYQLLEELGAIRERALTRIGRKMAKLPLDPRIARLMCEGPECIYEMLIIASAMSVMDVLDVPAEHREKARSLHGPFESRDSDFLTLLILWHRLEWHRRHLSRKEFKVFCEKSFISLPRYFEWRDVHKQLRGLVPSGKSDTKSKWARYLLKNLDDDTLVQPFSDWKEQLTPHDNALVHRPILAAFATQIAHSDVENSHFLGCRQRQCYVHPSSRVKVLNKSAKKGRDEKNPGKKKPSKASHREWIVAAEFVETQRLWARKVAKIQVDWVMPFVRHLLKYTYSEPGWSKKMGAVIAQRTSRLYGLVLRQNEPIQFKDIDLVASREIFIQSALVERDLGESRFDPSLTQFMQDNQKLVEKALELEAKSRTSGLMATDHEIFDFFDQAVPSNIVDRRSFFSWWKKEREQRPRALMFSESWFLKGEDQADLFPAELMVSESRYQLQYCFEPGHADDGVTILVPESKLYDISQCILDWLVPGLIADKCEALVRALPKQDRKRFVPIPQFVASFLTAGYETFEPLTLCMEQFLEKMTGYKGLDLKWAEVDGHLRMKVKVINDENEVVSKGLTLAAVKQQRQDEPLNSGLDSARAQSAQQEFDPGDHEKFVRTFKELPEVLQPVDGTTPLLYTTLGTAQENGSLSVIFTPDYTLAEHHFYNGVHALVASQMNSLVKHLKKDFLKQPDVRSMIAGFECDSDQFWKGLLRSIYEAVFMKAALPRSAAESGAFLAARENLLPFTEKTLAQILRGAKEYRLLCSKIAFVERECTGLPADQDLLHQSQQVLSLDWFESCCERSAQDWLLFVQCLGHRLEKRGQRGGRDDEGASRVLACEKRLMQHSKLMAETPLTLYRRFKEVFWSLQAARAGLFAQHMKVSPRVTLKNLEAMLAELDVAIRKSR